MTTVHEQSESTLPHSLRPSDSLEQMLADAWLLRRVAALEVRLEHIHRK